MASAVTVSDHSDNMGERPSAVSPSLGHPLGHTGEFGPSVRVLESSGAESTSFSRWLPATIQATGTDGRLVQLLRLLDEDPSVDLTVSNNGLVVLPAQVLRLRQLAMRCGVSSASTAGEWLKKWRQAGYLLHSATPTISMPTLLAGIGNRVEGAPRPEESAEITPATNVRAELPAVLDVVLGHLALARCERDTELVDQLADWAQDLIGACAGETERPRGFRAACTDQEPRGSSRGTERSEVVSFSGPREPLTKRPRE